ncbi:putative ATP-dependent RNA helicase DDX58 [Bagarius yarrelli]|uniref:Putative ATP-dependent RNA helicase DDX58 n=1 Tax=Bagarius yarrelli TaxID=175774 RepID=A0A556VBZ5_BAGYA|nr:putative ATP-dependent RNA helicase DDX58 [Bagarius yarrelli]
MLDLDAAGWFQGFLDTLQVSEYSGLYTAISRWDFEELEALSPHRHLLEQVQASITKNMKPAHHEQLRYLSVEGEQNPKLEELKFILDEEYCNNQETRTKGVLDSFKSSDQSKILIATSVADEGIDIPQCNLVLMYEHADVCDGELSVRLRGDEGSTTTTPTTISTTTTPTTISTTTHPTTKSLQPQTPNYNLYNQTTPNYHSSTTTTNYNLYNHNTNYNLYNHNHNTNYQLYNYNTNYHLYNHNTNYKLYNHNTNYHLYNHNTNYNLYNHNHNTNYRLYNHKHQLQSLQTQHTQLYNHNTKLPSLKTHNTKLPALQPQTPNVLPSLTTTTPTTVSTTTTPTTISLQPQHRLLSLQPQHRLVLLCQQNQPRF